MNLKKISPLKLIAFTGMTAFSLLSLSGCLTSKDSASFNSDGQSAFLASEMDQMGQVANGLPNTLALAKTGSNEPEDSIKDELKIRSLTYDSSCKCFVREADFTGCKGFERDREDSIWIIGAAGDTMSHFDVTAISAVIHRRHITRSGAHPEARNLDIEIDTRMEVKHDGDTIVGVWNGSIEGTFNKDNVEGQFKSGTITDVTRKFLSGKFQFPESGTVEVDRPAFHFLVEFLGDDKATVTITNKVNQKVHVISVDKDYNETQKD